jgi:hypothetical protein
VEAGAASPRSRIAIAAGGAIVLAILVVVIALASGGDAEDAGAAPDECIRKWNADPAAIGFGQHNFAGHGYDSALVTYLDRSGEQTGSADGLCAVLFPSRFLDPEARAAGAILAGHWRPISELPTIQLTRVAELQAIAAADANASLSATGKLAPL